MEGGSHGGIEGGGKESVKTMKQENQICAILTMSSYVT